MKILVAHPQRQHAFQLCSALVNAGHDVVHMTTVYDRPHTLTSLSKRFLSGDNLSRAKGRHCAALKNDQIVQRYELLGLVSLLLGRMPSCARAYKRLNAYIDRHFGIAVAKYAMRHDFDVVVCYDQHAEDSFAYLKDHAPSIQRVLDVSAGNKQYQAHIFLNDLATDPRPSHAWHMLMLEPLDKPLNAYAREIELADWFLAASTFTADSVVFAGGDRSTIFRCPYGSNFKVERLEHVEPHAPMRFVYCGRMIPGKGLHRLLQAFDRIDPDKFELTLIGSYAWLEQEYRPWLGRYTFTGLVLPKRVRELYLQSDVLVFASMCEGMSLACLEALGCGLPLVVSTTIGAADCVTDGVNGFVLESSSDVDRLEEVIRWCIEHPVDVAKMRVRALESSRSITWEAYGECIADAFRSIEAAVDEP